MNNMVTIWVVDDAVMDNAVERLVYNLANFNQVGLVTLQRAVMVQAEPAWADLLLKCLEASGLKMVVERALVVVDEPLAGLGEAVQVGAGDPAMGPVVHQGLPSPSLSLTPYGVPKRQGEGQKATKPCACCGEVFEPKTVKSRFCEKKDCQREKQRQYQAKSDGKKPKVEPVPQVEPVSVESEPEYQSGEPNQWWPWKVIDGADAGRIVTQSTMEFWLKTRRLPAGTMVEHFKRGQHMVDKEDGKKGMILRKVAIPHE